MRSDDVTKTKFVKSSDLLHNHATGKSNDLHSHQSLNVTWAKELFKYAGAMYFNSLPNYIKSATPVNSFKKMLTEHFTL